MQKYLVSMLKTKLGMYLDGLENTQMSFGVREASMSMTNVQFRRDALDKFMLPIDIKFGTIKQLTLKVPIINIQSSPVTIQLEGMDLILAPKVQSHWQFNDIFTEEYMKDQLLKLAGRVIADVQAQREQGWKDRLRMKILDNFTMNIRDVHVRFEDISEVINQRDQIGQTTFGCLLTELDLKTVDAKGNAIFHDRSAIGGKITKVLKLEGLAIYLNPQDTLVIHEIAAENPDPEIQISSMQMLMDKVVAPYRRLVESERENKQERRDQEAELEPYAEEDFLTYILKPMNMELAYEHETDTPTKSMKFYIRLEKLELSLQHQQLKAMLKLIKTTQIYKQRAFMQEKLRKFRQFRPIDEIEAEGADAMDFGSGGIRPGFDATKWWQFAGTCIMRSIQFKKGSLLSFKMAAERERECKRVFKATMTELYSPTMDDTRRKAYFDRMEPSSAKVFWHIVSMCNLEQLLEWTKQVVIPVEEARLKKEYAGKNADGSKIGRLQTLRNWFSGKKNEAEAVPVIAEGGLQNPYSPSGSAGAQRIQEDDEFDEFFDCINDTEETVDMWEEQKRSHEQVKDAQPQASKQTRERTSFSLFFNIKELSFTLGKLSAQNKIEGIQLYNRELSVEMKAPTLNISQQFVTHAKIVEVGINLISMNRRTNMIEECLCVIHTNNKFSGDKEARLPQLDMTLTKHSVAIARSDIDFDLQLSVGQIIAKYNEDLVIRAKAISRIKVDSSLQTEAMDQLEELRENTQSAIHSLIYRRRNKYNIQIGSPIFLLPINGTFEGAYSPIWAIRTGAVTIASSEPDEILEDRTLFENLSVERSQQRTAPHTRFNFTELVRMLMRSKSMPSSRGSETEHFFEHFRVTISQMGMSYFQCFGLYEEHARSMRASQKVKAQPYANSRFVHFPASEANEGNKGKEQTLQKFDVLEEFEIKILFKIRKKEDKVVLETQWERDCYHSLPRILMRVDTSVINISLSHSVYNNLFNLKNIFNISEEKASEYNKDLTQFNVQIKQQLLQESSMKGNLDRKVFIDEQKSVYERNHSILSGGYLYFYKQEESLLYIDYFSLKKSEMILDMKNHELVIQRASGQEENRNLKRSTFLKKRMEAFCQDSFEAGFARKLRFDSQEQMQEWVDQIREATMQIVLEWGDQNDFQEQNFSPSARVQSYRDPVGQRPLGGSSSMKQSRSRRSGFGSGSQSKNALMALKSFQRNQMHGNFNEAVNTFITTEESDTMSRGSQSKVSEIDDEAHVVKVEMDVSIPSFEVELMKLKLEPGTHKVAQPAVFEQWVTYTMIGMSTWMEQRAHDQLLKVQINKISLIDETMVINNRLMTQTIETTSKTEYSTEQQQLLGLIKHKLGTNQNFDEPAMLVEKKTYKKQSPKFDGIYMHSDVRMANIQINFMPGTFNNILKLMRATKKQTRPVDDGFGAGNEYTEAVAVAEQSDHEGEAAESQSEGQSSSNHSLQAQQDNNQNRKQSAIIRESLNDSLVSSVTLQKHKNRRYSIDQEQKMLQRATDINEVRNYDFDCKQESDRPMLVTCTMRRISIGMLHPDYQMELFRLHTNCMDVCYEVFYDHAEMSCNFARTTLYDLTGHPQSVSPKEFYKFVKRIPNLSQSPQKNALENPREMFYFNSLQTKVFMIQSTNCPHKEAGFTGKMEVRMDTMRVNHIQEINLRFNDYFMEQFMDCLFMSDPYKDPKEAFDEIRARDQIHSHSLSETTDFKFSPEIGKMDVQISNFEMKVKDRPHSKDYLLFEIPRIACERTKGTMEGLIPRKPQILLQSESIWTRCDEVNFWFGRESGVCDLTVQDSRLSLLKRPFAINVEFQKLSGSEVITKIPNVEMDKAARLNLSFTPIELIWPQSIYTYMLRCGDLNFSYSDGLVDEYFFIKWLDMSEHYQNQVRIVSKHFDIQVPALSITLQNSDGSFIAEMIWQNFRQKQKNYTDNDKEMNITCHRFFILDKINATKKEKKTSPKALKHAKKKTASSIEKRKLKQAVICPMSSPMFVNSNQIIHGQDREDEKVLDSQKNMQIFVDMCHNGDKTNVVNIRGLKIFLKFQTFIMMQAFMMNAFPSYKMDSPDKPNGFNEDPERANRMVVQLNITDSLICFLNKPGQDSIIFKGDITIDMVQESIKRAKESIEELQGHPRSRHQSVELFPEYNGDFALPSEDEQEGLSQNGSSTEDSSDKHEMQEEAASQFNRIYDQKISMKNFTSFICSLQHLDGSQSFGQLKKREMMKPVEITFENKYLLKRELETVEEDPIVGRLNSVQAPETRSLIKQRPYQNSGGVAVDNLDNEDEEEDLHEDSNQLLPQSAPQMARSVLENNRRTGNALQAVSAAAAAGQIVLEEGRPREQYVWGVTCLQDALITDTALRISIQDVHLLYKLIAYSSDLIASESIDKLKEINENIEEREQLHDITKRQKTEIIGRKPNLRLSSRGKQNKSTGTNYRSFTERHPSDANLQGVAMAAMNPNDNIKLIKEVSHSQEDEETSRREIDDSHGQELFDGLIERLENRRDNSMASQIERLSATTNAFRKIANGYTQKKYLERSSFLDFLKKDVFKPDQDNDSEDFHSANEGEISDDFDETGEESRRKTIMRINQRKGKIDPLGSQVPSKRLDGHDEEAKHESSVEDPSGMQSDILDEKSAEPVLAQIFSDRQGPSKKNKSSRASTSMNQDSNQTDPEGRYGSLQNRDQQDEDGARRSNMKESVQDALSEFWHSCGGGSFAQKHTSFKSARDKINITAGTAERQSHNQSEDQRAEADIEDSRRSYEPSSHRSVSQFAPYGAVKAHRENGQMIKSASFGVALRHERDSVAPSSINGSVVGEKSKAFFQQNETMLAQSKRQDMRGIYKHCMDNVIETNSELLCKKISFLFINDFNSAFTPVMELEMTGVNVEQNVLKADDKCNQMLKLHQMTGNYFNLELGEWEPFIENLALEVSQNQTLSQKTIVVNFVGPVIINLTQACVINLSYTREAWMSMPGLSDSSEAVPMKQKQESSPEEEEPNPKQNIKLHMRTTDSQSSYSINSNSTGEKEQAKGDQQTKKLLQQTFQPIMEEESKLHESQDQIVIKFDDEEARVEDMEDNSGLEQITPFQIKNQTNQRISVYEGGISAAPANIANSTWQSLANSSAQNPNSTIMNSAFDRRVSIKTSGMGKGVYPGVAGGKVFRIERAGQSNYSVTMADILDREQNAAQKKRATQRSVMRRQEPEQQFAEEAQDDLEQGVRYHISGDGFEHLPTVDEAQQFIQQSHEQEKSEGEAAIQQISFKNAVVVGVQLNSQDLINNIDMNEITHQDPYVYTLSSRYMLEKTLEEGQVQGTFNLNEITVSNNDTTMAQSALDEPERRREVVQRVKYSQFLEKERSDELGYYHTHIFYGVVLNKMQKQLVIRTPYVFYNKTLLTLEVVIKKSASEGLFAPAMRRHPSEIDLDELSNDKVRFLLEPEEKFPLDPMYYYGHSITVRVFDQNSVAVNEGDIQHQMSINKKARNAHQPGSTAQSQRTSAQEVGQRRQFSNQQLFAGRKFCKPVSIEGLTRLDLNQGPGVFVSGPESDSLCISIKRQPGELRGTTDIVFLPTLSVKNILPCSIGIKRQKRCSQQEQLQHQLQQQSEEKTFYTVQKSEQKEFYTFEGSGAQNNEVQLKIQVDGFLLSEEITLNQRQDQECDLEIQDAADNKLTIGMRVQPFKAGYQVTFFAHACVLLETVRLLNSNSIQLYYEAESIKQQIKRVGGRQRRHKLAGQESIVKHRFVMCNKDESICVSVNEASKAKLLKQPEANDLEVSASKVDVQQDYFGASQDMASCLKSQHSAEETHMTSQDLNREAQFKYKNLFFSQALDIKQAGKLTDFSVKTESTEMMGSVQSSKIQHFLRKYDFQMNTSLALADFDEKIFTKLIVISPKYVLVNQMKGAIEVAQLNTQHMPLACVLMESGDRREWVWTDYNRDSLISVRKSGFDQEDSYEAASSDDGSESEDQAEHSEHKIEEESSRQLQKDSSDEESDAGDGAKAGGSYKRVGFSGQKYRPERLLIDESDDSRDLGNTTLKSLQGVSKSRRAKTKNHDENGLLQSSKKKLKSCNNGKRGKPKSSHGKSMTTRSRKLQRKVISDSGWTEADRVMDWDWSCGFSPAQNEQMTMAIMIRESDTGPGMNQSAFADLKQPKIKVIRVTKKLMNNTVFVIFEDESEIFPMYRIINECRNVKVQLQQYDMDEPKSPELITFQQNFIFGFYEPENARKIQLDLLIDKNDFSDPLSYRKMNEELAIRILDLASQSNKFEDRIAYQDSAGQNHEVVLSVTNDGQTQTVHLSQDEDERFGEGSELLNERLALTVLKQEDEEARKKLKKQEPDMKIEVKLDELLISFVAKVQKSRTEQLLIEENAELALWTWQGINFQKDVLSKEQKHNMKLTIGHFQIDNQSSRNPLFQQIFRAKRYHGARNSRRGDEEAQSSNPFFNLAVDYRVSPEKKVTFVDRAVCTIAESCLCIESDFLVNWGWAVIQIRPYFDQMDSYVHPLFTKQSICEIKDAEVEELNMCDSVMSDHSSRHAGHVSIVRQGDKQLVKSMAAKQSFEVADLEAPLLTNQDYRLSEHSARRSIEMDFVALTEARKEDHDRVRDLKQPVWNRDLLTNIMGEILIADKQCHYSLEDAPTHLRLWYQQDVKNSKETLYLKEFLIDQVNMDLSFVVKTADSTDSGMTREHVGPLSYLKMSGLNVINIDEARFRVERFGLQNYFIGKDDLLKQMSDFYGQAMLSELKKMVGSVGIMGSPRMLFYSIGDGFHDFIAMPLDGFTESGVLGATYGMATGTISLTKQIGLGSLQSVQQALRDFSQFILIGARDKDYMRRREDRMITEKPQHFVDGFGYGANSFIQSLKAAVTGVLVRPYVEVRRRGFRGIPSGLWQSLAGVPLKPCSGLLDLTSKSCEGLKNTIRGFDVNTMKERVRLPRTFYGVQRKIKKYDRNDALLVEEFLAQVGEGRFAEFHFLETKLIRSTKQNVHLLMLTEEQLFLVEATQKELVWNIKTELISEAKPQGNGIVIILLQEFEGQEQVSLEVDASSRCEIRNWLNAIAIEFN